MHQFLIEMLECPACHGELDWEISNSRDKHIWTAAVHCKSCQAVYPVEEGIGAFLTPDLQRKDLWAEADSFIAKQFREDPALEKKLMEAPLEELSPTDQFLRSMALEDKGNYTEANLIRRDIFTKIYTAEYVACWEKQYKTVTNFLADKAGPIIDLASGRGYLAERLLSDLQNPIIVTDFSPSVLRKNRVRFEQLGYGERLSLLAFDARRTPFKNGAVRYLTTNVGLGNIEQPGNLVKELRRIVSEAFLAIANFFPEDDTVHVEILNQFDLKDFMYHRNIQTLFEQADWQVEFASVCNSVALPTPESGLLKDFRLDGLPVAETTLEWATLIAR